MNLKLDDQMVNNLKVNREEIGNLVNLRKQSQNSFQSLLIRFIQITSGIIITSKELRDHINHFVSLLQKLLLETSNSRGQYSLAITVKLLNSSIISVNHCFAWFERSDEIFINIVDLILNALIVNVFTYYFTHSRM